MNILVTKIVMLVLDVPYDLSAVQLKSLLETMNGIGSLTVSRTGTSSNFYITVTFDTLPGL